jgi:hypothetical protein
MSENQRAGSKAMAAGPLRESDLYPPVRDFLVKQGFEVRGEVHHCDVAAFKDGQLIVVELKKHLSVDLLVQAAQRQKVADAVYIAIPKPKKRLFGPGWRDLCHLLRRLELGLLLVTLGDGLAYVEQALAAQPFDRVKSRQSHQRKRQKLIQELNGRSRDCNLGGSRSAKLLTVYRENALYIACCLERFGPLSPKQLRELGAEPRKTGVILQRNVYAWFARIAKGKYGLSPAGGAELASGAYAELVADYRRRLAGAAPDERGGAG